MGSKKILYIFYNPNFEPEILLFNQLNKYYLLRLD